MSTILGDVIAIAWSAAIVAAGAVVIARAVRRDRRGEQ